MSVRLQPAHVRTGSKDSKSQLVFADGYLVAVLVQLSDEHGEEAGMWFLEAGFGPVSEILPPVFVDLDEAQSWIIERLADSAAQE